MVKYLIAIMIFFMIQSCSFSYLVGEEENLTNKGQIMKSMMAQESAWNRGSVDDFMEYYWKSDSLSFVGAKGVTYGWDQVKSNYKKGYPDQAAMGSLKFDILELYPISKESYHMIGKFTLKRKEDEPSGHFTLLWKKINDQWLIVNDHTSG